MTPLLKIWSAYVRLTARWPSIASIVPFIPLLAAWWIVLSRWSGQRDIVVITPVAGRSRSETEGLVGLFMNTLALRGDLHGLGGCGG